MPGVNVRNEDLFISQLDGKERRDQLIVSESSKVTKRKTKKKEGEEINREEGEEFEGKKGRNERNRR